MILNQLLLLLLGATPLVLPFAFWRSHRNIVGIRHAAFAAGSFAVPIAAGAIVAPDSAALQNAAIAYVLGVALSLLVPLRGFSVFIRRAASPSRKLWSRTARELSPPPWLVTAILAGFMLVLFQAMGFYPAFAEDPLSAKFFRGQYEARYQPYAVPYRAVWTLLPISMVLSASQIGRHKIAPIVALLCGTCALALALTRTPALGALQVLVLSWVATRSTRASVVLMVAVAGLYMGAVSGSWSNGESLVNPVAVLARETPDPADLSQALTSFDERGEFTKGRTILGGLVPGRYEWNPANWSLSLVNPRGDLSSIASGGFRLPPGAWGFFNFGIAGAFMFGFVHTAVTRAAVAYYRMVVMTGDATLKAHLIAVVVWDTILIIPLTFYTMSFYQFFAAFSLLLWSGVFNSKAHPEAKVLLPAALPSRTGL